MDIALDANILIRDPWLKSQNMRILVDHVKKSKARILLSEAVRMEVEAHLERGFSSHIDGIRRACRNASRNGVLGVPDFSREKMLRITADRWKGRFRQVLDQEVVTYVPMASELLPEVVSRSAQRKPPCSKSSGGIRDAIIWLSLLEFVRSRKGIERFAFVSANTKDFADRDGKSLAKALVRDAEIYDVEVFYYPSLKSFLREYAESVSHIDLQWLRARVEIQAARQMIENHINTSRLVDKCDVCEPEYRERFVPAGNPDLSILDLEIEDFQLWEFDDKHIEATLSFGVHAEGECVCVRDSQLRLFYEYADPDPTLRTLELKVVTRLAIDVSAQVVGDAVELSRVEGVSQL